MKTIIKTTLLLLALLLPATVLAHDFEVDGIFYNIINGNEVEVTYAESSIYSYPDRYSGAVTIPSSVVYNGTTFPVTAIGLDAFNGCAGLTSVSIPNTVTTIGKSAFYRCSGLTSINIPNSVIAIGNSAFNRCTQLSSIQLPTSVTDIGYYAFDNTAWYNSQSEGLVYIGMVLYKYKGTMPNDTTITIRDGTLGIAGDAFEGCTGLTTINIPNSVTTISTYAFEGCSGLTTINNPNSIVTIGNYAFYGCTSLTNIDFMNSVTTIGDYAFYECAGLTSITIPRSVTNIGKYPFCVCPSLTSIQVAADNPKFDSRNNCNAIIETATNTLIAGCNNSIIPNSVATIGDYSFVGCQEMTSIDIPNSVTAIGYRAFASCSGLTSVTIPNSVTSIGGQAFYGCSGLTNLTIPNSVTAIGERAFGACTGLMSIIVDNDNPKYDSRDNCNAIFETATNTLITGCNYTIIPNSVTAISNYAFYYCTELTSVTISESVTAIGDYAFGYCNGLNDVYCHIIDPSQISMGDYVFVRSMGVEYPTRTLHVVSNPSEYQNDIRWSQYFDRITTYDFEVDGIYYNINGNEAIVTYGDNRYTGDVSIPPTVTIDGTEYSVTSIGKEAFYECSELTNVFIPNTVTAIGRYAFEGCIGLTSVVIPNSVTILDRESFRETGLTSVVIPGSVKTIGEKAFMDCENLTDVTLSEGLIFIDEEAFSECGITEIHLPESLVRIGEQAFEDTYLTSITIPKNVAYLGNEEEYENDLYGGVFDDCHQLMEVNVDPANATYASYNGMLLTKNMKTFLYYPGGRSGQCVIPNSVTTIGGGWGGFDCQGLTSVIIPSNVEYIADGAFDDCDALTLVRIFTVNPPSVGDYPFSYYSYSIITLEVPAESVETYRAHEYWGQFQNIQPIVQTSGDVNGDGNISIADVTELIDYLLTDINVANADVNNDGKVSIADVTELIDRLLTSGK